MQHSIFFFITLEYTHSHTHTSFFCRSEAAEIAA
jgi:hypothetical protein